MVLHAIIVLDRMVKNRRNSTAGFTFIEIIIVITIMTLLSGISLASYGKFTQIKKLEAEFNQFKQVLEVAKKKTVASDKSSFTVAGTDYSSCDLFSYKVSITSSSVYSMIANVCDNTGACPLVSGCQDITLSTYTLSAPIVLSPTSGEVQFSNAAKTASGLSSIILTHTNLNQSKTITIDRSGLIY